MPTSWPEVMQHRFQVGHQGHGTNLLMEGPGGDTEGITPQLDVLADGLDPPYLRPFEPNWRG